MKNSDIKFKTVKLKFVKNENIVKLKLNMNKIFDVKKVIKNQYLMQYVNDSHTL